MKILFKYWYMRNDCVGLNGMIKTLLHQIQKIHFRIQNLFFFWKSQSFRSISEIHHCSFIISSLWLKRIHNSEIPAFQIKVNHDWLCISWCLNYLYACIYSLGMTVLLYIYEIQLTVKCYKHNSYCLNNYYTFTNIL